VILVGGTEQDLVARFTRDELLLMKAALNEVCNGVLIDDFEFQTRLGCNRSEAGKLLQDIGEVCRSQ
jgi:hypothetical protein